MNSFIELADYRRRVAEMYADVRYKTDSEDARSSWATARDDLFRGHPQTPIENASSFAGLEYFPYDPVWRLTAPLQDAPALELLIPHSSTGETRFLRIGSVTLPIESQPTLDVFWLDAYGGGIFVPFADATNGTDTYGGGRYILDTVKGADLGVDTDDVILDFNFAYHPSCTYSPRWSCPLAPPGNRLNISVRAGERLAPVRQQQERQQRVDP